MNSYCKAIGILFLLILLPRLVVAGPSEHLSNFFNRNGGGINITAAGGHGGQRAGYYTLGGVSSRSPMSTVNPISFQGPGFRGGCPGIDAQFGAFSHIKSPELKKLLNNIVSAGANYAFMIGFETLCPMCKKTMDQLNKLAQEINQWGINSCETAATIMGGILPKTEASTNYLCPHLGEASGFASDRAAAKHDCGVHGKADEVYARAKNDPKTEKIAKSFMKNGNLAWMILKSKSYFANDNQDGRDDLLRELMMSLSGSLIAQTSNEQRDFRPLPSLVNNENLYNALLLGGVHNAAEIYRCDTYGEEGCLNPGKQPLTITEAQSFKGKTAVILRGIQQKILNDEGALTPAEIEFVNNCRSIPIEKAFTVQATHSFVGEIINLEDYAEIIAADLLVSYLDEMLSALEYGTRTVNANDEEIDKFRKEIKDAKYRIHYRRTQDQKVYSRAFDFIQKLQLIEKMTAGEFSADLMQSAQWAAEVR